MEIRVRLIPRGLRRLQELAVQRGAAVLSSTVGSDNWVYVVLAGEGAQSVVAEMRNIYGEQNVVVLEVKNVEDDESARKEATSEPTNEASEPVDVATESGEKVVGSVEVAGNEDKETDESGTNIDVEEVSLKGVPRRGKSRSAGHGGRK